MTQWGKLWDMPPKRHIQTNKQPKLPLRQTGYTCANAETLRAATSVFVAARCRIFCNSANIASGKFLDEQWVIKARKIKPQMFLDYLLNVDEIQLFRTPN